MALSRAIALIAALLLLAVWSAAGAECHDECCNCDSMCCEQCSHARAHAVMDAFVPTFDLNSRAIALDCACRIPSRIPGSIFRPPKAIA